MAKIGRPPQDPVRRAHRILDAAAELILRWGYDKTTIDDVAKRAGVAKGTIYLHWRTRDDLFVALLRRERVHLLQDVQESAPATLGELFGQLVGATMRRPLFRAVLLNDQEILGRFTALKRNSATRMLLSGPFETYFERLVGLGAVRKDLGDQMTVLGSIVYGFVFLPDTMPEEERLPGERIAELVTDTIERTTTTGRALLEEDARAVAQATSDLVNSMAEVAGRRFAESLGTEERVL